MRAVHVELMLLAACGRVDFNPLAEPADAAADASADASVDAEQIVPACTTFGPWGAPVALTSVNSDGDEQAPTLSSDGNTMYFDANRSDSMGVDIYKSVRVAGVWGTPIRIEALSSPGTDGSPELTRDGLTLYFNTNRETTTRNVLWRATRAATTDEFANPTAVAELADPVTSPTLTRDGTELIFTSPERNGDFKRTILAGGVFGSPTFIDELNSNFIDAGGTLADDDLTLYFLSNRSSVMELLVSTRTVVGGTWATPISIQLMNDTALETNRQVEISANGSEMVFSSDRPGGLGQYDLYIMSRGCL